MRPPVFHNNKYNNMKFLVGIIYVVVLFSFMWWMVAVYVPADERSARLTAVAISGGIVILLLIILLHIENNHK